MPRQIQTDPLNRYRLILLLIRSRDLYDFHPPTSTGQLVRRASKAGEGPSYRDACPDCELGMRRIRGMPMPCATCSARGWIERDAYTERQVGSEATGELHRDGLRRVPCDACRPLGWTHERSSGLVKGAPCRQCEGTGWAVAFEQRIRPWRRGEAALDRTLVEGLRDPLLRCMVIRDALGSYDALAVALGALLACDLYCYRATVALEHDSRPLARIRYDLRAWAGLQWIERRMPEPIRLPPDVIAIERRQAYGRRRAKRAA